MMDFRGGRLTSCPKNTAFHTRSQRFHAKNTAFHTRSQRFHAKNNDFESKNNDFDTGAGAAGGAERAGGNNVI